MLARICGESTWERVSDLSASRSASSETSFPSRADQSAVSCPAFKHPATSCFAPLARNKDPDQVPRCKIHLKVTLQSGFVLGKIISRIGPVVFSPLCVSACSLVSVSFFVGFFHETQSVINNKKEGDNYKPTMCRSS